MYDPNGIDRTELLRLANKRAMVQEFDTSKLSKDGFLVLIKDKDVKLPNGTVVENGMMCKYTSNTIVYELVLIAVVSPQLVPFEPLGQLRVVRALRWSPWSC